MKKAILSLCFKCLLLILPWQIANAEMNEMDIQQLPLMILVEEGTYYRGGDENSKYTSAGVDMEGFYIAQTELTRRTFDYFSDLWSLKSRNRCLKNCDVPEGFSYLSATRFIQRLNEVTGLKFRLATELEWEYACTARGEITEFCGSNNLDDVGVYSSNRRFKGTHPAASLRPNNLGLYDMTGNLSELVSNCFHNPNVSRFITECPGQKGLKKGGNYFNPNGRQELTVMGRGEVENKDWDRGLGLRLVLDL